MVNTLKEPPHRLDTLRQGTQCDLLGMNRIQEPGGVHAKALAFALPRFGTGLFQNDELLRGCHTNCFNCPQGYQSAAAPAGAKPAPMP